MHALVSLLAALALLATSAGAKAKPRDSILLSQVESLTLRADRQTTHRRVPAAPQLKCVSPGAICSKYKIDVLRCENKGSGYDSEDIQWSCNASLPPELKLGSTDVICEGYSSPDDPYVLKGSCAVEYRLALTREGEEKWPDLGSGGGHGGDGGAGLAGWVFWVIFFCVLAFIVYNAFINAQGDGGNGPRPGRNNGGGYWGGGGGGGGGGDDFGNDDPPPPYPGTNSSNNSGKPRRSGGGSAQRGNNVQQDWRPDFWSAAGGAAAGAAAAYGAGRMGRNNNNTRGNGAGYGGGNYGSTWGSGGGTPSRSGSSGSSSGSGRVGTATMKFGILTAGI
ncbi:hypothetical protein UCDDA912_g00691 [Diaporthe ampelina]|uniref:Store-operated calcium entry-associated regulatory factor n=1 Tax=Diaporthe ampelina TaxID=1214573 RepID=A0A0G2FYW2_9PEZI|nr:hypothetical protein UCDDA912_g00691 [Diaporthe ampelina]